MTCEIQKRGAPSVDAEIYPSAMDRDNYFEQTANNGQYVFKGSRQAATHFRAMLEGRVSFNELLPGQGIPIGNIQFSDSGNLRQHYTVELQSGILSKLGLGTRSCQIRTRFSRFNGGRNFRIFILLE